MEKYVPVDVNHVRGRGGQSDIVQNFRYIIKRNVVDPYFNAIRVTYARIFGIMFSIVPLSWVALDLVPDTKWATVIYLSFLMCVAIGSAYSCWWYLREIRAFRCVRIHQDVGEVTDKASDSELSNVWLLISKENPREVTICLPYSKVLSDTANQDWATKFKIMARIVRGLHPRVYDDLEFTKHKHIVGGMTRLAIILLLLFATASSQFSKLF